VTPKRTKENLECMSFSAGSSMILKGQLKNLTVFFIGYICMQMILAVKRINLIEKPRKRHQ
jgi:hypothetical protein